MHTLQAFAAWRILLMLLVYAACCGCRAGGHMESLATVDPAHECLGTPAGLEARFGGLLNEPAAQDRLDRVGARLASVGPKGCSFRLLNSDQPNAISLPNGRVYVTRGLFEWLTSDDLLAAALAHEMAHVAARDGLRARKDLKASLAKEIAADLLAARYLRRAGYAPCALIDLLRMLEDQQRPGWAEERVAALASEADLAAHESCP